MFFKVELYCLIYFTLLEKTKDIIFLDGGFMKSNVLKLFLALLLITNNSGNAAYESSRWEGLPQIFLGTIVGVITKNIVNQYMQSKMNRTDAFEQIKINFSLHDYAGDIPQSVTDVIDMISHKDNYNL